MDVPERPLRSNNMKAITAPMGAMHGSDEMDGLYGESKPKGKPESIDQEEQEQMAQTALVPMKVASPGGEPVKPGDEIVMKVVAVHDDEVEMAYAPKKKEGMQEEGPSADEEIDSMDKPGTY